MSAPNNIDPPSGNVQDFAPGPSSTSPISLTAQQQHNDAFADFDQNNKRNSFISDASPAINRSASVASTSVPTQAPSRSNTLKKKGSVRRTASLRRSSSKRSLKAGSIKGLGGVHDPKSFNSAFYTPIPTHGAPTEVLADRFQAWRQLLKSLITYFREIQVSYDQRAKAVLKVQNTLANIAHPTVFTADHGLGEASRILDDYHRRTIAEANKSREIENDVIGALSGLRSDLGQKIKEIKSLSGDFKNSVEKEKEVTRREVDKLQEVLQHAVVDDRNAVGKHDPYVVRLGVERAIERQIDEENYLHRAYLNLESSGRELESIVVGEVQKAYNALAGILKREADDALNAVENLRNGPISMPKDQEWMGFVVNNQSFVDPSLPLRRVQDIEYPGKHNPSAAEVRAGMLERKSKYLKSYTPGWYVLSPTHLHEFKSADKIYTQPPVMSLYLLDQRLGSKSEPGSSSHKFMLKGKQSGGMHKGHNWVFRAETHDTMLAWFEDIRTLTETTGEARDAFVRKHARSVSATSDRGTVSSDGMEEDEADRTPYSAAESLAEQNPPQEKPQRPQPGGRFPSDLRIPSVNAPAPAGDESDNDVDVIAAAGALPASTQLAYHQNGQDPYRLEGVASHTRATSSGTGLMSFDANYYPQQPLEQPTTQTTAAPVPVQTLQAPTHNSGISHPHSTTNPSFLGDAPERGDQPHLRPSSSYGDWMAPAAVGVAGVAGIGVAAQQYQQPETPRNRQIEATEVPQPLVQPSSSSFGALSASTEATEVDSVPHSQQDRLGGLEGEGAVKTGRIIPAIRHKSDMSVSALHVPGSFP